MINRAFLKYSSFSAENYDYKSILFIRNMNIKNKLFILTSLILFTSMSIEEANFNLAKQWYEEKKYEKSAREFEEISKKYPFYEKYKVLYYAGKSYFAIKNYEKALYFYERLYAIAQNEIEKRQSTFELAKTYYFTKKYLVAIRLFNEFIVRYSDSPVMHATLYYSASANEKLGKTLEASLLYKTLIENYPSSPYADEAKISLEKIQDRWGKITFTEVKTNEHIVTNYEKQLIIITNVVYLTNTENTNTIGYVSISTQSLENKTNEQIISNEKKPELYEDADLLNALKKENLKGEEEIKRYKEIIELKNRLLKIKEKLLEEKKGMVIGDEESN